MADGAYRWQGMAPPPDLGRIEAIDAAWDDDQVSAFAEPARAAAVERLERALAAARTGDLTEASAQLTHARSVLDGLDPAALEPRRGLAGLFDSRGGRLKRFRAAYDRAAAGLAEAARALAERIEGAARRSAALDEAWTALRDGVADLDAHLAVAARRLSGQGPDEGAPPHSLGDRRETLDACRAAALRALPLVRGVQGADARSAEALKACAEGLTAWRDDCKEALGLSGRRPRRVRPDRERLARGRDEAVRRIDAALRELTAARTRRAEIEGRMADLRRPL
jgi:hypothetical protein